MGGDGHGHGHGHHQPYEVPDYRIYKVEDVPQLMATKRVLAALNLKDPWLRNEVWRFNPKEFGTHSERLHTLFFRGFKWGFGAFLVTIAATAAYDKMFPSDHGHDGHGEHGKH